MTSVRIFIISCLIKKSLRSLVLRGFYECFGMRNSTNFYRERERKKKREFVLA